MPEQPEVRLVTKPLIKAIEGLRSKGCMVKVRKRHGGAYGTSGEPDIEACIDGRSVQIECKAPGNTPTPLQLKRLQEWEDAGALAFWTDSWKSGIYMIETDLKIKQGMTTEEIGIACDRLIDMIENGPAGTTS